MTEPNSLNKFWADGGSAINAWLAINSPVSAEAMAKADWDTVTIDCQHGMVYLGRAMTMIEAVAATDGDSIFAVRYGSEDKAPTLYIGPSCVDGQARPSGPAVMVLSEPLDSGAADWREVRMSRFVTACKGVFKEEDFSPRAA